MDNSSSQRVEEWGGVMSVGSYSVAGHLFNHIQWELYVFLTRIPSWALLDRCVDAAVDDSCDDANMQYLEWWLPAETVKFYFAPGN